MYNRHMINIKLEIHVREVRKRQGLSLFQLSQLSGISETYISEVERGLKSPSLYVMCALAAAMDVHIQDLYICNIKNPL